MVASWSRYRTCEASCEPWEPRPGKLRQFLECQAAFDAIVQPHLVANAGAARWLLVHRAINSESCAGSLRECLVATERQVRFVMLSCCSNEVVEPAE